MIHRVESQRFQLRIVGLTDYFRRRDGGGYSPSASAFFGIIFSFMSTLYARAYSYETNFTSTSYGILTEIFFDIYYLAIKESKIHYEQLDNLLQLLPDGFENFCVNPTLEIPLGRPLSYEKAVEFVEFVEKGGIEDIMKKIWREMKNSSKGKNSSFLTKPEISTITIGKETLDRLLTFGNMGSTYDSVLVALMEHADKTNFQIGEKI